MLSISIYCIHQFLGYFDCFRLLLVLKVSTPLPSPVLLCERSSQGTVIIFSCQFPKSCLLEDINNLLLVRENRSAAADFLCTRSRVDPFR